MKTLLTFIGCLFSLCAMAITPTFESFDSRDFTTNNFKIRVNTNRFSPGGISASSTNITHVAAGTNITIITNVPANLVTINADVSHTEVSNATNGLASTNYVNSATNGLASTNYVNLAATNSVHLIAGTNVSIGTNFTANTVSFTISSSGGAGGVSTFGPQFAAGSGGTNLAVGFNATNGTLSVINTTTSSNGYSVDGLSFFLTPTNTPGDGDLVVATGDEGWTMFTSYIPTVIISNIFFDNFSAGLLYVNTDGGVTTTNLSPSGVTSVSADTNFSVATPTTTPAITLTNTVGTGALVKQTNSSVSGFTLNGATTNKSTAASSMLRNDANQALAAVTVGSGLTFDGTTLASTGGGGSVTSVGNAPAYFSIATPTTTPIFTLTNFTGLTNAPLVLKSNATMSGLTKAGFTTNQNVAASSIVMVDANQVETNVIVGSGLTLVGGVLASTASGAATNAVDGVKTNGVYVLSSGTTNLNFQTTTSLTVTGGVSGATVTIGVPANSGGTVTSVAQTVPSQFSVSGSPVTTSGTFAITLTNSTGAATAPIVLQSNSTLAGATLSGFTTNSNVAVSSLVMVDVNRVITNAVVGSGLTLSGGVLASTGTGSATNAVTGIKTNGVEVIANGVTNINFQATTSLTVTGGVVNGAVTIGVPTASAGGGTGASTFNNNQFDSTLGVTNISNFAPLTNTTFWSDFTALGDTYTQVADMRSGELYGTNSQVSVGWIERQLRDDDGNIIFQWSGVGQLVHAQFIGGGMLGINGAGVEEIFVGDASIAQMTATNGFSSDGVTFTLSPTNAPTDAFVVTATGTGGASKWAAASVGSQTPWLSDITAGGFALIGPLKINNTSAGTNGSYSDATGQIHSNAVGSVKFSGGKVYIGTNLTGIINTTNVLQVDTIAGNALNVDTNRGVTMKGGLAVGTSIAGAAGTITFSGALNSGSSGTFGSSVIAGANLQASLANDIRWSSSSRESAPVDGTINFSDSAGLAFTNFTFGPGITIGARQSTSTNYPGFNFQGTNASWLGNPLLTIRGGTNSAKAADVVITGALGATNGLATYATTTEISIPATGLTNTMGINATAYVTAVAVSFTINNRANTVIYTSPTLTATLPVHLQPGWSVQAASGLSGSLLPN